MGVPFAPAVTEYLGYVHFIVAVGVLHEKNVGSHGHDDAVVGQNNAGGNIESIGKDCELVGLAIAVGIFTYFNAVVGLTVGFLEGIGIIH